MKRITQLAIAFAVILTLRASLSQGAPTTSEAIDAPPEFTAAADPTADSVHRLQWWTDARFGMFIHWGLYAQDGCFYKGQDGKTEHMMRHLKIPLAEYAKIADDFNPVKFDADQWVSIAKNAGMKYMIITSKHHDGFAMFNSPSSDYNIVKRTPWHRDPVKELADACRKQGIKFGVYYSLGRDWQDPDVPTRNGYRSNTWDYPDESKKVFSRYFERKVKPQVRELLTQYGPIAVMWFDTPEMISKAESQELVQMIHSIQPDCIVNSRVGHGLGEYAVQEQKVPTGVDPKPWETCMTLNGHWGYKKNDDNWKPAEKLVRTLIDVASKGGNFLLNVGPTGEGIIPQPSVQRLAEVGQWMKVNGQAIYGTTASPFEAPTWGRYTRKLDGNQTTICAHVFDWPADGKLTIPQLKDGVSSATLLATGTKLETSTGNDGLTITLPADAPDKISSTIVLKLKGPLKVAH